MKSATVNVFRFAAGSVCIGFIAAIVYLLFEQNPDIRGAAGGLGIIGSLIGSGVSIWFALRGQERRMIALTGFSLLPLVFWCRIVYIICTS